MTREEAIQKVHTARVHPDFGVGVREAMKLVSGLAALGVLELDVPKTIEQQALAALETRVTPLMAKTCMETLAAWGFVVGKGVLSI